MIIDTHVHIGGKNLTGIDMSESIVLEAMEKYKVQKAIVSNADSTECDHEQKLLPDERQCSMYDSAVRIINFARNNPKKIYAAIWVKSNLEKPTRQFAELLKRNSDVIKAIKFHPFHSHTAFNDEKNLPYLELAQKLKLPVIVHSAFDSDSSPDKILEMAKKFPDVKFVLAHLELGSDNQRAISLCASQPNLYGDTAWVPISSAIDFVKKCGSEKLMFGTDMPIDGLDTYSKNKNGQRSIYQDYFFELTKFLKPEDYDNIMFRNAQNFYRI